MKTFVVAITDREEMARSLDRYIQCFLGDRVEPCCMTYDCSILSGEVFTKTDLFVLELFRHDDLGVRAEAIPVAEKWIASGKRVLIISGGMRANEVDSRLYWDMASTEPLYVRIENTLDGILKSKESLQRLRISFQEFLRPQFSHHSDSP